MLDIKKLFNKDLVYTGLNQLWRIISGPIMMVLIPLYLTAETQGYWYMFISLAALAIFADLGFSNIILQFAAHEFAYLKFEPNGKISGDEKHLKKLASFFRFSLKWLSVIIMVAFPIIVCIGYYYLSKIATNVDWVIPWIIYSICSGIVFFYSSILCFFEGCNSVSAVQNTRLKIAMITSAVMISGLLANSQLYALSFSLSCSAIVGIILTSRRFGTAIKQLWNISGMYTYPWFKEFFNLLWRYAISWGSGYFLFQLYTPLTFNFHGAVEAGKVGISIALWTAGYSIANTWIAAITPRMNILIATKEWKQLDKVFLRNLLAAILTFILGAILVFTIYVIFQGRLAILERFISKTSMLLLFSCWLFQLLINSMAVYLRAHKKEPLMLISFISAIYVASTTYLCARYLDAEFLFLGYLSSYIFIFPYVIYIFEKQRKQHDERVYKN